MRQYFTYRQLPITNGWLTPDRWMRELFVGLEFTYKLEIITNHKIDGRRLGYIEVNDPDQVIAQDKINAILEGIILFGVHKKTVESAQTFCTYLTGKTPTIDGDKLIFPTEDVFTGG